MMVVLDTNVLVSGLIFGGIPARILAAWSAGAFTLILTPSILDEYRRVGRELANGRAPLVQALDGLLATLAVNATVVNAPRLVPGVIVRALRALYFIRAQLNIGVGPSRENLVQSDNALFTPEQLASHIVDSLRDARVVAPSMSPKPCGLQLGNSLRRWAWSACASPRHPTEWAAPRRRSRTQHAE